MTGVPTVYAAPAHGPRVGQPLPLFTLPNSCGRLVRLWDFKQRRPVVLLFIHGAQCQHCLQAMHALAERRDDLAELRAAVLIVAPDPTERLAEHRTQLGLPFTLLSDASRAVAELYLRGEAESAERTGLFVADQYGECSLAAVAAEACDLPSACAVLAELAHASQSACSCLVPAWPEAPQL
jgi:peroxiredoxin